MRVSTYRGRVGGSATVGGLLLVLCGLLAPAAHAAEMQPGNYELLSDRWNDNSWVWSTTYSCGAPTCGTLYQGPGTGSHSDDLNVLAIPRPSRSKRFQNTAYFADGRYTLTIDVVDGVRCVGYNLPSHDVYSWDAATLAGTVVSNYDAGCFGAPGGSSTYDFVLRPL